MLLLVLCAPCHAAVAEESPALQQQIDQLKRRVQQLEQAVSDLTRQDNWKNPVHWSRLERDMPSAQVRRLLGTPARIEEKIFTTWYYHATSKLHSYVWFDEERVLGWEPPQ